jgi:hypothetical protein
MRWYSYTTRALQRHLALTFGICLAELKRQEEFEDRVRAYWTERKKAGTLPPPKVKRYNGGEAVYYKLHSLTEKIALYRESGGKA